MFNTVNILDALKNYIRIHGGQSAANNIAEAVNDLNSIPQGSGGGIPEAPIDGKQYARKDAEWSEVQSSGSGVVVNCEWNQDSGTVISSTTFSELMEYLTNGVIPILNVSLKVGGESVPNAIMISSPTYVGLSAEAEPYIYWSASGLTLGCMENTGWGRIVM